MKSGRTNDPRAPAVPLLPALALLSVLASSAFAQKPDSTEDKGHGFPWIAHSSIDIFYLNSPAVPGKDHPYQASLYQGFTIQSLAFAWFHIGLRSRETL